MITGLHVKCRYSCQILMKLEFSRQLLEKMLKYDILWKSFQREPSWSTRPDEQTYTKLIVLLRKIAKSV